MGDATPEWRSRCPINIALEMLGDRWSLLIVRDLLFKGCNSYGRLLASEEGIATNILADRLGRLEGHGIVSRLRDPHDARRIRYRLTEKGIDLAPTLVELILWSARHEDTAAPPDILRAMAEDREGFVAQLRAAWAAADA